jgi:hypothetical protein
MHNNPEEHRFQYSMMAGLRINRNRMPQVLNMKLYKMHNRKTNQDKYNKSEKRSCTRTWEERFGGRGVIHR